MPESPPLPFWLKATALNSSEQPVTVVSVAISSYMHTAEESEEPEEEPEPQIFLRALHLKTWTIWVRWWRLTAVALPLVFKKKAFGVIGAYLKKHTHTRCGFSYSYIESTLVCYRPRAASPFGDEEVSCVTSHWLLLDIVRHDKSKCRPSYLRKKEETYKSTSIACYSRLAGA